MSGGESKEPGAHLKAKLLDDEAARDFGDIAWSEPAEDLRAPGCIEDHHAPLASVPLAPVLLVPERADDDDAVTHAVSPPAAVVEERQIAARGVDLAGVGLDEPLLPHAPCPDALGHRAAKRPREHPDVERREGKGAPLAPPSNE